MHPYIRMNQTHILFLNHEELKSQLMGAAMQPFIKSLFDRLHVDRGGTLYNSFEEVSLRRPLAFYDICRYQPCDVVCVCQGAEWLVFGYYLENSKTMNK